MLFTKNTRQYEEYAHGMMKLGHGHAFLDPASDSEARPGICGFIDDNGRWQKLVDLTDANELASLQLEPFTSTISEKRPKLDKYGPLRTDTVARVALTGDAAVAAGMPANVGAVAKYELQGEFGAVLVCHDLVQLRKYPLKDPFRRWARSNARQILQKFPDVKKSHSFYVMTSTLSARDIRITSWSAKGESVVIAASTNVDQAAKLSASTEFYLGQAVSEWHEPQVEEGERKVLFFGGVRLNYSMLWPVKEQDETKWSGYRGADDDGKFMVDDSEYVYHVDTDEI